MSVLKYVFVFWGLSVKTDSKKLSWMGTWGHRSYKPSAAWGTMPETKREKHNRGLSTWAK